MNKRFHLSFLLLLLLIPLSTTSFAETISLSTYYPAPFGAYDRLRLVPRNTVLNPSECTASSVGSLAVGSNRILQFCGPTGWEGMGGWTQKGDYLFPSDKDNADLKVGIGTSTPTEKLDVNGNVTINGNITGANLISKTFPGRSIALNKSGLYNGVIDFQIEDGSLFRTISAGIVNPANSDMFFQLKPATAAGYGYIESYNAAGLVVGTGDSTNANGGPILFRPNRITQMTLTANGNLGIGTTTPANRLDVEGSMAIGTNYSGTNTAPTNGLIIEGNVGIGVTSPGNSRLSIRVADSVVGGTPGSRIPVVRITGTTDTNSNLGDDVWFRAEGRTNEHTNTADSGVIWMEYGTEGDDVQAPILNLADYDNPSRIQFIEVHNGTETNPAHLSWIGLARGDLLDAPPVQPSGDMAIMPGYDTATDTATANVGIGTLWPTQKLHIVDTLRLEPRPNRPTGVKACSANQVGSLYYDNAPPPGTLCVCNDNGWQSVLPGGDCN